MYNKFNRSQFLDTQTVNKVVEKDLVMYNWVAFKLTRSGTRFLLTEVYLQRPDLLSLRFYKRDDYWWIISKVNNIDDWWNDLYIGQSLLIPDIRDIDAFYANVANIKRK